MSRLIKLVKTYRVTTGLADQRRLMGEILPLIEPDLRFFVFSAVEPPAGHDVLQEILKSITLSLKNFKGDLNEQLWAWCYAVARNRIKDHYRHKANDRLQPMPHDDLWELLEASEQKTPLSPGDRHDLEYAMKLLTSAKPECYDYLWKRFIFGMEFGEIASELNLSYDNVRMKIVRCLDEAKSLVS